MKKGFTLLELVFLMALIAALGAVFLPYLARSKVRSSKINCVNNLKEIGLSHRLFANDNGDKFPTALSTNLGGSLEYVLTPETFRHFLPLTNELGTPKVLICSEDSARNRSWITNLQSLQNSNLSYFIGLDAQETTPELWISGDRNLEIQVASTNFSYPLTTKTKVVWGKSIHNKAKSTLRAGNIGLADGSVSQWSEKRLQESLAASPPHTNRISIPK